MREFMTRVSDYLNEWKNDPERKENQLSIVVIGAVAVVIIVLLLLLLWWGHGVQEKKKEESARNAAKLQAGQERQTEKETQEAEEAKGLITSTYEEKLAEYMSRDFGEQLRQEYLMNTNELAQKIKELQETMEKAQAEITTIVSEYRDGDAKVTEKLTMLERETGTVVEKISALESKITELSDTIRTVDEEKIPQIQKQIEELRGGIEQARANMADIHEKIKALEKEDKKLWESLSRVEQSFEKALGENMKEIDNRMDHLGQNIDELERKMSEALEKMSREMDTLAADSLSYRYEEETNTLYLMPNQNR